jgi:RNA polymerase sigma-70 factor (ECF subfamily)
MDGSERFTDANGSEISLRDALAQNHDAIFRFLRKMSGDEDMARDLCQDVMVKAILGFRKFRGSASFRTWLLSIAANLYRDSLRKNKPVSLHNRDDIHDSGREAARTERRIDAQTAFRLLSALPVKKRKALVLRLELGYSYEEIARILVCPVGTVRSRIHEGIESLRIAMGEEG